jgi:outer membrane protein TolC
MNARIIKPSLLFMGALMLGLMSQSLMAKTSLSLDEAIQLALSHDPRIEEKRAFVRKAQAMLDEAEGSADFRYGVNSFLALATGLDGGFYEGGAESCSGTCTPRSDTYDFNDGFSLWAGMTFSIVKPLATFGRLENYQKAAQQNILVKQEDVELQRDSIRLNVVKAYYGFLAARDGRFLLEDTHQRLESSLVLVNQWLDEDRGNVNLSDRYALESGLGLVESFLAEAKGIEVIAMEGLKLLTGLQSKTVELVDRRLRPLALPDQTVEEWIQLAIENRPEFRQVKAGLSARRALVEATRADSKPIIFAGVAGSLSYAPGRDRLDNPHIYDLYNHTALSPVVGLSWEWEAGAQPARVAQAQADLDALIHKASFARQGIPFQVREQYQLVQSKFESIAAMKSSAKAARRWMIAAYADFEAGLEEPDKVLAAMQVYVVAYSDYLKNVNDFNNYVFKLKSVSGVYE